MMLKKCHLVSLPSPVSWKVMKHWKVWWNKSKIKRDEKLFRD
jgi:hypothetical protein